MLSPLENHVLYLHLMGTDYKKIAEILEKSPKSIDKCAAKDKRKSGENAPWEKSVFTNSDYRQKRRQKNEKRRKLRNSSP